ncbi:MAG: DUF6531 domain-containing protein [Fuerstiella sp.]
MTLAAKHMDPVVGVDVHIIQPPGPVPPVPIPHPFIGFLIDPFDYVPIVGSTVMINGMHRAQAGTAGKCVPPHIPIGGVFVKPPANECEMFMGSATVEIDGDAQSYMSLPALSCQCIGMPPIPRMNPKKKSKTKSLVLPTSLVLPIPCGPPVMIGGPPTISLMAMGMKVGMAALGKAFKKLRKLQKASKRMKKISDKIQAAAKKAMKKLGVPPSVQNKVSRGICSVTGHPVDIATGKMFTDIVDFELSGPLSLSWERVYYTTSTYDGPFGRGWHHSYDLGLTEEEDAVAVRMSDGRPVAFPTLQVGETSFDRAERLTLGRDLDGYFLRNTGGLRWNFGRVTFDSDVQAVTSVEDRAGNRIEFDYDKYGHLEMIHDSCGRQLPVRTDDAGRIVQIRAPHPDKSGETIKLAAYEYDYEGRLVEVRDALEQPVTYRYDGSLMVQETDRNGLSFYFEYDGTDHTARCIHTWGDDGIYNHSLEYDVDLRRTIVTNSLGHQTTHFWNDDGVVYRAVDPLGNAVETVFNEFSQPLVEQDELGQLITYEYDDRGNRVTAVAADGASTQIEYNELDLPVRATDPLGNLWNWQYNARGQLAGRISPGGLRTEFQYDAGRLSAIVDSADNMTRLTYDVRGNLSGLTSARGAQCRWEYDGLGRPTSAAVPNGVEHRTYDLLGRLVRVAEVDGNIRTLSYDANGNVTYAKDVRSEVRYTYRGMGRLATRREAGTTVEFRYNSEEDLIGIVNEHGFVYHFDLDARGEVLREFGFDGVRRLYTRDDLGRVVRVERATGLISNYRYDPVGRVTEVNHSDGTGESFVYREDGQLLEATNDVCSVKFERDWAGRILKEWQDELWVSSAYDDEGRRLEMRSCFGAVQRIDRNRTGDVVGVQYSDAAADESKVRWDARIERDELGREVQRFLPGGVRSRWERDRFGRPLRHTIDGSEATRHSTQYEWSANAQLDKLISAHHGMTVLEHDEPGRLVGATYGDGTVELRMPDAVGNLFRTRDRKDRTYGKAGELLVENTAGGQVTYFYDDDGNLLRKSTPDGEWHYSWNAAGMLESVVRPDGEEIQFEYDSLGRRVSKTFRGRTTRWLWDGGNPIHEWVESQESEVPDDMALPEPVEQPSPLELQRLGNPPTGPPPEPLLDLPSGLITWLFDPNTFEPCAKIVGQQYYSIITDHLGRPAVMLDSAGKTVWSSEVSVYGALRNQDGERNACPFRWLGQYEDEETGLYYNRHRYYDPDSGVYISQDPVRLTGGANLYGYVSDPCLEVDPFGLNGEVFYRTMSQEHYDELVKTGRMPGTGETSTSPTKAFSEDYKGVTVEFEMKPGTTAELEAIGISDGSPHTKSVYPDMPSPAKTAGWNKTNARFKTESLAGKPQINIQLGKGKALDVFNDNIVSFKKVGCR